MIKNDERFRAAAAWVMTHHAKTFQELAEIEGVELGATMAELIKRLKQLPPPTEREVREQALSFVHGILACSTHYKPQREAFAHLAREEGWTAEEFAAWAADREWWV